MAQRYRHFCRPLSVKDAPSRGTLLVRELPECMRLHAASRWHGSWLNHSRLAGSHHARLSVDHRAQWPIM